MKLTKIALMLGSGVAVIAAGILSGACSSSSGGSGTTTQDSGMTMTEDSSMAAEDAGTDACGNSPSLHPTSLEAGGGVYCPFGGPASETTLYCGAGDAAADKFCCISGEVGTTYPPSVCQASCSFTATSGNTTIQCEDPATDCPTGNICCGGAEKTIALDTSCSYYKLSDWVYTKCEATAACAGTATAPATGAEFQLCTGPTECPAGKTCTPFKSKGVDLGFCM
jgi:hypothetical protein